MNEDDVKHDPHPKKRTKTNIGKHWSNILQNTQKYPKNTPKCPKNVQNERKKRKKRRKIVKIWTNVDVNDVTRPGSKSNVDVIDATRPGSWSNADDVEEALTIFARTKTKTKRSQFILDERSQRLPILGQRRQL